MPILTVMPPHKDQAHPVKAWTAEIEQGARQQLMNIANLPFVHKHVAAMPDVHLGKGATVGSVIATKGAIIPAAVGVDIGCGMCAVRTTLNASDLPDSLRELRLAIEAVVPLGAGGAHDMRPNMNAAAKMLDTGYQHLAKRHRFLDERDRWKKMLTQIGSLGSGNHFIELCLDEEGRVWVMLHSGSRGIGNIIGTHFIELAKKEMERHFIHLPDKDLAYLVEGSEHYEAYVEAVGWAQSYAQVNRATMMKNIIKAMNDHLPDYTITDEAINCHHNYIDMEHHYGANVWVTRKGAIRAREGDLGIIPGSMGTRSYIVRGKGNRESFCSCSHGAGRRHSRGEAKRLFSLADLEAQTAGIECRKDAGVLDEIPGAYKDIDEVMANQTDLVEVVHELRQVLNIKG